MGVGVSTEEGPGLGQAEIGEPVNEDWGRRLNYGSENKDLKVMGT